MTDSLGRRRVGPDVEEPVDPDEICEVLGDDRSMRIVRTLERAEGGLTASELAEAAEIPTSTVYRKMDAICATPLVEGAVAIAEDGPQATRYEVGVDAVRLAFTEEGIDADVETRELDEGL